MDGTETLTAATPSGRPSMPVREDCWSEDASYTLIEAWGERYLELNRGNLRQKHWQEVADAVNDRHGAVKKARRTDVQCKNRIDTLKKKYKLEKARVLASAGTFNSRWPFYNQLDALIGTSVQSKRSHFQHQQQPVPLALSLPYRKTNHSLPHALMVPVAARSVREKRSSPAPPPPPPPPHHPHPHPHPHHPHVDDSFFRRNYSAIAAAAAADPADSGSSRSSTESRRRGEGGEVDGFKELAQAISRFAEIYERVEGTKQRQMIELEKERMEFMKSLEFQRMQLFMDSQVQLEKIKRAKRASASDIYD